jgi:hypothetical protein
MKIIVKQPKQCSRKELDMFCSLLYKLSLSPSAYTIKNICKCHLLGLCVDGVSLMWISAIKNPTYRRKQKLTTLTNIDLHNTLWEYWYVYVLPKYRWLGISKKIYTSFIQKLSIPLYATVKESNIPMKKILTQFWFTQAWNTFKSTITDDQLHLYLNLH